MKDILLGLCILGFAVGGIVGIDKIAEWHAMDAIHLQAIEAQVLDLEQQSIQAPREEPSFGSVNTVGGLPYYLYGSGIGASDSSLTLTYFYIPVSHQKLQMTDFGTVGYLTLEPGNTTKQEFVSFTGVTQNSDGTATLTGISRGLSPITPFTASTTLQKAHAGGTQAVISNPPQLYQNFLTLANNATSSAILTYGSTTPPRYDNVGAQASGSYIATTSEFASILYVNNVAIAGASNSTEAVKGIVELGTARETASSTLLGGTAAGLVIQSKNATDTPQNCSTASTGGCVIMSLLNGKLNQSWLDLTQSFVTSGAWTFAANASNKLTLNGLAYTWGGTRAASSTVLSEDGSGNITFEPASVAALGISGNPFISSAAASTSARQIVIPANTLASTTMIRIKAYGLAKGIATNAVYAEIVFGNGVSTSSVAFVNHSDSSAGINFQMQTDIFLSGPNAETAFTTISTTTPNTSTGAPPAAGTGTVFPFVSGQQQTTSSFTTSSQLYLNFILHALNASNEIRYSAISVEVVRQQ